MVQRLLLIAGVMLFASGCASTQQKQTIADLQTRVADLERDNQAKDTEIKDLRSAKDSSYTGGRSIGKGSYAKNGEILRVNVAPETAQRALKAAGYYTGNVDGKLGGKTKVAIAKFQKDHGLKADGIIGEKTWTELKGYATE